MRLHEARLKKSRDYLNKSVLPTVYIGMNELVQEMKVYLAADEWDKVLELGNRFEGGDGYFEVLNYVFQAVLLKDDDDLKKDFLDYLEYTIEKHIDDDEIVDQLVFFAGILYHMLDMFDKAEQMFGELLKYRENKKMRKTDVLYELGSVHLDMNKFEQAEGEMLALFKEYKNRNIPPPFFVLMGEIIQKQKRFDEAKYWYDRAIRYDKYDHEWYKKCALMLEECGRYKQALKYWNKIISLPKDRINETVCDSDRVIFKEKQYRDAVKFANIHREICEKHKEQEQSIHV